MENSQKYKNLSDTEQLDLVKENNAKIQKIINTIIQYRKDNHLTLQNGNDFDKIAENIFKLELQKCIKIYKAEYGQYDFPDCRGSYENISLKKENLDCSGGDNGLKIGSNLFSCLAKAYKELTEFNVQKSGAEFTKNYDGSKRDQLDFLLYLKEINGIDIEFVLAVLSHEAKHIYGVIGGNTFLKEGITEQSTREDCDKYGMYMSPTSHTPEANFIRKLELVVGRDEIIKAGLYDEHVKYKNNEFEKIRENDKSIEINELDKYFKILGSTKEEDKIELEIFQKNHPNLVDKINDIKFKYNTMK